MAQAAHVGDALASRRGGDEAIEHREGVERAGRALGVVLDRLDRELAWRRPSTDPSLRLTWLTRKPPLRQRLADDLDLVVLGGHLDEAGVEVADGVVRAVVAEPQPARLGAGGAADDLVSEADPEQRPAVVDRGPGERHGPGQSRRVARAGRQDDAGDVGGEHLGRARGMRQDPHPHPPPTQAADDVRLQAEVDDGDQRAVLAHRRSR